MSKNDYFSHLSSPHALHYIIIAEREREKDRGTGDDGDDAVVAIVFIHGQFYFLYWGYLL